MGFLRNAGRFLPEPSDGRPPLSPRRGPNKRLDGSTLRPATSADLEDLLELEAAGFGGAYAAHRWGPRQFRYYLRHPRARTAVARLQGRTIGYVSGLLSSGARAGQARLNSIVVAPGARRSGVGRALLEWFLCQAEEAGAHTVVLEVSVSKNDARSLFERAGFGHPERLTQYYGPGRDGLRLRKRLGQAPAPESDSARRS